MLRIALVCCLLCIALRANGAEGYLDGYISDVTFTDDDVFIRLSSGAPGNCATTIMGWMKIKPTAKTMKALVLGIWLRGDAAQTHVVAYTSPPVSSSYCEVYQLDPAN